MLYIDIEKELIPYRFDISLDDVLFTFEVHYNAEHDFFTLDLERDGETLAVGVKVVYGQALFDDVADSRYPTMPIIPYDLSGSTDVVTWATLSVLVYLYLDGVEDE